MNMYELNLKIHVLPKSLNKVLRTNRFRSNRTNRLWDAYILNQVKGQIPAVPLRKAKLTLIRRYYRTLDYDGLVASMKPVVDALVSARIIQDDSWNTLGPWTVLQEFRRKADGPELQINLVASL